MKILILTNNIGGLHSFRKEVVKALVDVGHQLTIAGPDNAKKTFFEDIGCTLIFQEISRRGTNPLKDLGVILQYRKLIKQVKPSVVLTYTIKPNLYGGMVCQLCGVPQIANITGLGTAVENSGWLQKLTIALYKVGMRHTNTVFFQNKANMEFCLQHGMVNGKMKLIPGSGVNLQHHTLQKYPPVDEPLRFLYMSRLLREKGIGQYLETAERIKAKYPEIEFHILGRNEDGYEKQVRELQERDVVIYHGAQLDVRPYIKLCHCTILPSFYPEGMSNVLLESCATGRPIITTDRPGCKDIVEEGVTGFVVKQRDADDLVEKVERFIALPYDQKRQMGLAARRKVEREFDRQVVVDAYLNEINSIAHV